MADFVLNPGQGTLHKNDKGGVDTRPDRRGELNIDGTIYELSGWIKEGRKGQWLSLTAKPKEARKPTTSDRRKPVDSERYDSRRDDSEVPF